MHMLLVKGSLGRGVIRTSHFSTSKSTKITKVESLKAATKNFEHNKIDAARRDINPNVAAVRPSKTAVLTDLAKMLKEEGKDIITLSVGEPDFDTPAPIVEAGIEAMKSGFTKYTINAGMMPLRKAICNKLKIENGLEYTPDCIVVSNGAKQSVWQCILATCSAGDEVLIPAPYWVSYPEMTVLAGATPKVLPCPFENDFLLLPEQLENSITDKSRILILCSPSNPTGSIYTKEQLAAIARVVEKHPRLLVLSDEIYEYIVYNPAEHFSFASLPNMWERTFTVNGFSKGFAMTGWRLGYVAAPPVYAQACNSIQGHSTSAPGTISQKAGIAALEMGFRGGDPVRVMVEKFKERRNYVISRLEAIKGMQVSIPKGAFYVFPNISAFIGDHVHSSSFGVIKTSDDLCHYLIAEALVATVPGEAFGDPQCLRISYASSMENLKESLDRIETALSKLKFQL